MIDNIVPLQTERPASSVAVARDIHAQYYADPRSLIRWQGTWWEWTGTIWREMTEERLDSELQRALEAASYLDAQGAILRWDPTDTKIAKVRNALKGITEIPDTARPGRWFDGRREHAIPCRSGYIGFDATYTGTDGLTGWETHDADPELFATAALTVDLPNVEETPEEWLAFLRDIFLDEQTGQVDQAGIDALQEWFGYMISGRTDLQVMLQLLGPKRSGKGTIGRVIEALYGTAYGAMSMDALGYRFGLQGVLAKPVLVLSDVRDDRPPAMAVERLLSITGEDPVRIDIKNAEGITTRIPSRIMIMANSVLKLPDNAGALDARSVFIRTRNSAVGREDRTLGQRLTTRSELALILRWAFHGLERLDSNHGRFTQQSAGGEDRRRARALSSPIAEFLTERYERQEGARVVQLTSFHDEYLNWRMHSMERWKQTCVATQNDLDAAGIKITRPKDENRKSLPYVVCDIVPIYQGD